MSPDAVRKMLRDVVWDGVHTVATSPPRASINAGITDLNTATQQGRMNEELSTNMAKADRWDDFYESMANSYSDMANLDQSNYLLSGEIAAAEKQRGYAEGVLNWLNEGKSFADYETPRLATMAAAKAAPYESKYADLAAQMTGSTWTNPGVSEKTKNCAFSCAR